MTHRRVSPRGGLLAKASSGGTHHAKIFRAAGAAASASLAREFTVAHALGTPHFAAIAFTYLACCAAHSGPIFHMVSYAIDCGVPAMAAATVFGAAGVASLSGRIIGGLSADRIGAKRMIVFGSRSRPSR